MRPRFACRLDRDARSRGAPRASLHGVIRRERLTAQSENSTIEATGKLKRRRIIDRPGGADEICHSTREERFGKTRRHQSSPLIRPVRRDTRLHAFEKMKRGMRSMRFSSFALRTFWPVKIHPESGGFSLLKKQ